MHTHRCEQCAKDGKEVIWIHPNADAGQISAHTCPECGTVNWKQCKVENGKLPQPQQRQNPVHAIDLQSLLGYIMLAVGLALLGYAAYVYVKERKNKAVLP